MSGRRRSPVFTALVDRLLTDTTFAQELLHTEEAAVRMRALKTFLDDAQFPAEQRPQALEDLIQVLENTDLTRIEELQKTLDGDAIEIPF